MQELPMAASLEGGTRRWIGVSDVLGPLFEPGAPFELDSQVGTEERLGTVRRLAEWATAR